MIARKALLAALLLLCAPWAHAADVQASATLPNSRVDGTPMDPLTELTSMVFEHGTCGVDTIDVVEGEVTVPVPGTTATITRPPGEFCVRAYVIDTEGLRSDYSVTARATVPPGAPPAAPIILQLTWLPADGPPSGEWVVAALNLRPDRPVRSRRENGTLTTTTVGRVFVGSQCDCSERAISTDWSGDVCSVSGQTDSRTGASFPYPNPDGSGGAFSVCVQAP